MATGGSRTITTEQLQAKYRPIVLKLKSRLTNSRKDEPQHMLNNLQNRVNNRFNALIQKFVINENEQMNKLLLEKLEKVKDPDTFLEAFLTHLYGRAVNAEEDVVSPYVTNEENHEIIGLVEELYAQHQNY